MLAAGERREARAAAQRRGRAGEQDRPAPAGHHALRRLAAGEKARKRGQLPDLAVFARRLVADLARHIRTDVEYRDLDRADLGLDAVEERDHGILVARVAADRHTAPAVGRYARGERRERIGVAAHRHLDQSNAREGARDCPAGRVARTDDHRRAYGHMTIFPSCFPAPIMRCASAMRSSGSSAAIAGTMLPAAPSASSSAKSAR